MLSCVSDYETKRATLVKDLSKLQARVTLDALHISICGMESMHPDASPLIGRLRI